MTRLVAVWLAFGLALLAVGPSAPFAPQVITPGPLSGVGLTVTITVPTSATTYDAGTSSTIAVSGTAQSDRTVTGCTYTNSLGGSGSTTGTTSWSIASVALTVGSNVLTVTCTNVEGSVNFDVLTITRSASGGGCVGTSPQVCTETGTLSNGSSLVIGGSGFGTKSVQAPFLVETFESTLNSKWDSTYLNSPSPAGFADIGTSNQRHAFSTRNMHANFKGTLDSDTAHMTTSASQTDRVWFVSYWLMLASNWTWPSGACVIDTVNTNLANIKTMRIWSPNDTSGSGDESFWVAQYANPNCVGNGQNFEELGNGGPDFNIHDHDWQNETLNVWHLYELEFTDEATSNKSANDGAYKIWVDGDLKASFTNRNTMVSGGAKRPWDVGFWNSWGDSSKTDANDYYEDDVYVEKGTFQRVYICDGSTYAARSTCELQPHTAWSDTSVTVTLFRGAMTTFSGKYLYVLNAAGTANTTGFQLP